MANRVDRFQDEKGASARYLVLMFLAAVAVCAVFFALGYVVGYNHSPSKGEPVTENVTGAGNIPPTVNPPSEGSSQSPTEGMVTEDVGQGAATVPKPERPKPSTQQAVTAPATTTHKAPERTASQKVAKTKPAAAPRQLATTTHSASSSSHFAVQVMASKTRGDAENLVKLLKSHGYPVYLLTPQQAHAHDNLYRVQVGPFTTRVAADLTRDKLVGEGFRPFVVH